jgi:general secretion pathway protein A
MAGNLLAEAAAFAASAAIAPASVLCDADPAQRAQFDRHGYCVVLVGAHASDVERRYLAELLVILRKLSAEIPLVWPVQRAIAGRLDALGLRKMLRGDRVTLMAPQGYAETVALLSGANCILTDSRDVQVQAAALDVPSLMLSMNESSADAADQSIRFLKDMRGGVSASRGGLGTATVPDMSARHRGCPAAERVAEHLARWMGVAAVERPDAAIGDSN